MVIFDYSDVCWAIIALFINIICSYIKDGFAEALDYPLGERNTSKLAMAATTVNKVQKPTQPQFYFQRD
jgi:hypothetical protein